MQETWTPKPFKIYNPEGNKNKAAGEGVNYDPRNRLQNLQDVIPF